MDLSTRYLGLTLDHPFTVGASPLVDNLDTVRRLEDGGASAIVLHSLFEEQITMAQSGQIHHMDPLNEQFSALLSNFPVPERYPLAPDQYLDHIHRAKAAVRIPIIASLNGTNAETWLKFALRMEQAGADALELNMYQMVADPAQPGVATEAHIRDATLELKRVLKIPIAVKLSPFFTAFGHFARQLDKAGADGLVLFNRFYQPDIDIRKLAVVPRLELSTSSELLVRLRWAALLYGRFHASLAICGGVATPPDGVKALLAGAQVIQMVSAILRHGPPYFMSMREGLARWMEANEFASLDEVRGRLSALESTDPNVFERANYIRTLQSWTEQPL